MPLTPTPEELRAIRTLKRLAKRWPKSLWLFAADGSLHVMKRTVDGRYVYRSDGLDGDCSLDTIDIPGDGSDW